MMKIHIMNLLHGTPKGVCPPPQGEASIRCCSATVESMSGLLYDHHQEQEQINPNDIHRMPVERADFERCVSRRLQPATERRAERIAKTADASEKVHGMQSRHHVKERTVLGRGQINPARRQLAPRDVL